MQHDLQNYMEESDWYDIVAYDGLPENYPNWIRVMRMLHGSDNITEDLTTNTIKVRRSKPKQ